MNQQRIYEWIKHPERLNRETLYELRTLLARYPYFHTARLLYLRNLFLLHDIAFGEELRRSALYIADRKMLFQLVEGDNYAREALEKTVSTSGPQEIDRTLALIDTFLSSLPEEQQTIPLCSVDVSTDYTSYLLQESDPIKENESEDALPLKGQTLIDDFLEKKEVTISPDEMTEPLMEKPCPDDEMLDDESYFTETLAKIYVKQHRYSKALEIIRKLNLKYPKKNAYFADQIRFLEKLIINTKSK